jgi:hypothetical protein
MVLMKKRQSLILKSLNRIYGIIERNCSNAFLIRPYPKDPVLKRVPSVATLKKKNCLTEI